MIWHVLIGFAWAMAGLHALDWCAGSRTECFTRLTFGFTHWLVGWIFIVIWPVVLLIIVCLDEEGVDG